MLWKSSIVEAVTPVTPKSARALCSAVRMYSAHAGKIEISRKKEARRQLRYASPNVYTVDPRLSEPPWKDDFLGGS